MFLPGSYILSHWEETMLSMSSQSIPVVKAVGEGCSEAN